MVVKNKRIEKLVPDVIQKASVDERSTRRWPLIGQRFSPSLTGPLGVVR